MLIILAVVVLLILGFIWYVPSEKELGRLQVKRANEHVRYVMRKAQREMYQATRRW